MMYSSLDWQWLTSGLSFAQGAIFIFAAVLLANYCATLWFSRRRTEKSAVINQLISPSILRFTRKPLLLPLLRGEGRSEGAAFYLPRHPPSAFC